MNQAEFDELMRKRSINASVNDIKVSEPTNTTPVSGGLSDAEFDKLMQQRKGRVNVGPVAKTSDDIGFVEEAARGLGRAPISMAATPFELLDVASSIGTRVGSELAAKVTGGDADKMYREERTEAKSNKFNPLYWNQKILDAADKAKSVGFLKPSESVGKDLVEGYKDPNWWAGNIGEGLAYTGILLKTATSAIKKQAAKQIATLGDEAATEAAKKVAEQEIKSIGAKAVAARSVAMGAAMSHGEYRKWEKEHPEEATVLGDSISSLAGGVAGAIDGITIGSIWLKPFIQKFGTNAGTKAATNFYKEVALAAPKGFLAEAPTEGIQTYIENVGKKYGYDEDQELMDGVLESMVIGGVIGAGFGASGVVYGKSGKSDTERSLIKIDGLKKATEKIQSNINKDNNILATFADDTDEYKKAAERIKVSQSKLDKYNSDIVDLVNIIDAKQKLASTVPATIADATPIGTIPTDAEAFGTRIDPSLTIKEVADGIDNGTITKEQWTATPKGLYTPEQIAAVDQHFEDYNNKTVVDRIASGESITSVIPTVKKPSKIEYTKLPDNFTDDDAVAALDRDLKLTMGENAPVVTKSTKLVEDNETLSQLSDILGVKLVNVSIEHKGGTIFNGIKSPGNDKVLYINDKSERPAMWILGHEFSHTLEKTNPDAYNTLLSVAKKEINPEQLAAYQSELDTRLALKPGTITADVATKDMLGDFVGDKFADKNFWDKVYNENPNRFKQIVTSVKEYIRKIISKFGALTPKSEKFFNDVLKMDRVLTDVVNEHVGFSGASDALVDGKVETGDAIDLNKDGKHWTHIRLGSESSVVLRETRENIILKRLSRPGSRKQSGLVNTSNKNDKGVPTAALNELKKYAKENNKNIIADKVESNPYLIKHGFINDAGSMVWHAQPVEKPADASAVATAASATPDTATDPQAYEAARKSLESQINGINDQIKNDPGNKSIYDKELTVVKKDLNKLEADRIKVINKANSDKQKAKSEILELKDKIKVEDDNIHITTSRDSILFSQEQIEKFNKRIDELEKVISDSNKLLGIVEEANDKENEREIRSDGQRGTEGVGDTQNAAKSEKADGGNRNKQIEKKEEVKKEEPKKPKLADKIDVIVKEEEYKTIEPIKAQLKRITDTLARDKKHGDPVAFMDAIAKANIKYDTVVGEVEFQEAFRRHMMAEENAPTVIRKSDEKAVKAKIKKDKQLEKIRKNKEEKLKLNILTQMLTKNKDGVITRRKGKGSLELVEESTGYGESVDPKEYEAEIKNRLGDRDNLSKFQADGDGYQELQFSVDPNKAFIANIHTQIEQFKLDTKLPKQLSGYEWKDIIKNLTRNGKMHPAEVEFSYINEWLDDQEGNITREEVLGYLKNNAPKVTFKDVRSDRGDGKAFNELMDIISYGNNEAITRLMPYYNNSGLSRERRVSDLRSMLNRTFEDEFQTYEQRANAIKNDQKLGKYIFNEMKLAFATNAERNDIIRNEYWEIYNEQKEMHLEEMSHDKADALAMEYADEWLMNAYNVTLEEIDEVYEYQNLSLPGKIPGTYGEGHIYYTPEKGEYKGSGAWHWGGIKNILAHFRYAQYFNHNDTNEDVFVILEAQSDWHADGEKWGYVGGKKGSINLDDDSTNPDGWTLTEKVYVPKAPYEKTWPLLVFKHALIKAYNNSKKVVAWPSQADQVGIIEKWGKRIGEENSVTRNYTNTLPRQVGEFVKKYNGKVEKVNVSSRDGLSEEMFAVRITPEMEQMMEDRQMPQFSVDPIDPKDPHPNVQEKIEEAGIVYRRTRLRKIKDHITALYKSLTSPFGELRPGKYGFLKDKIRLASEVDRFGSRQAYSKIYNIVVGMTDDEKQVFTMNIILNDILNDTIPNKHGIAILTNENLPFGYKSIAEVRESLRHFRDQARKSGKIMTALANRRKTMLEVQKQLIDEGFIPKELLGNDTYFHHQTIEKMAHGDDYLFGVHTKTGDRELSFTRERSGGDIQKYSTDYIVAEFSMLSSAIAAVELNKIKKDIKAKYDITAKLARQRGTSDKLDPPEGFVKWYPGKNLGWGSNPHYPDALVDNVLTKGNIDPKIKEQMQIASGLNDIWIIPARAASALSRAREVRHEEMPSKVASAFVQTWKIWTLVNPFRFLRYNINNIIGDVDIAMAYDPKIMKYGLQSMKDIAGDVKATGTKLPLNMQRWGTNVTPALKDELDIAHRLGVLGAGFVMHEITDVGQEFEALMNGPKGNKITKLGLSWWQGSKDLTNYRENILRLAAFRYFKDRLKSGDPHVYGASNPAEINEITNIDERAAKLARDLIGDYGNLSEGGKWVRKHMIPFYSWMEINAPRYVRMMRNLKTEGGTSGVGMSALANISWKGTIMGAKFMALTALVHLWNMTFFGDEEDELKGFQERGMHLILGRNHDGSVRYLSIQGAFRDALSWFAADNIYQDVEDIKNGDLTIPQKLAQVGGAPFKKIFMGAQPIAKTIGETVSGYSLFPDPTEPIPIKDRFDHIAKSMSLELVYRYATGKPTKGVAENFTERLYWNVDPGESAYYHIRNKVNRFNKELGYGTHSSPLSDKALALNYYKQSLRYGDLESAEKYLNEYLGEGGTGDGVVSSIMLSAPTGGLRKNDKGKFYRSLSNKDKEDLNKASKWYKNTYRSFNNEN